jgi:acetyl-CoA acyltransferase
MARLYLMLLHQMSYFRINDPRVNPNGGAIALGHPLGASGVRLVTTAINQLHKIGGRYALCTMCIGVGQGIAVIIERA